MGIRGGYRIRQRSIDEFLAEQIEDRAERIAAVGAWTDAYIDKHGQRPPAQQLELLADYILREELADKNPDKMTREEYPIMSEWQRVRRLKSRIMAGVVEIDYRSATGYRKTWYVDDDGGMRSSRQRMYSH